MNIIFLLIILVAFHYIILPILIGFIQGYMNAKKGLPFNDKRSDYDKK